MVVLVVDLYLAADHMVVGLVVDYSLGVVHMVVEHFVDSVVFVGLIADSPLEAYFDLHLLLGVGLREVVALIVDYLLEVTSVVD